MDEWLGPQSLHSYCEITIFRGGPNFALKVVGKFNFQQRFEIYTHV